MKLKILDFRNCKADKCVNKIFQLSSGIFLTKAFNQLLLMEMVEALQSKTHAFKMYLRERLSIKSLSLLSSSFRRKQSLRQFSMQRKESELYKCLHTERNKMRMKR